jgi:hypothetical protein
MRERTIAALGGTAAVAVVYNVDVGSHDVKAGGPRLGP